MTVDFLYRLLQYIANQFQRGNTSPARFNLIIQQANISFLDYLLGQLQQYSYGSPAARVQFGVNETARQRLTPLIDPVTTLTIDVTGQAPYPADFQQVDAMYAGINRIRFVPQHKLPSYRTDPIDPISTNPIYILESGGFRFYPNTTDDGTASPVATLSYVKTPPTIFWGGTPDGQGRPVYDPGTSTDPIWYPTDCLELVSRALKMVGVNLSAPEVSQYADGIIKQGQ